MNHLGKWQLISLGSRFLAMLLGILQSIIITRILSVSEFGIIGIVGAIGAMFGIAQHFGLASGTTREISSAPKEHAFQIFLASLVIKYIIVIPVAFSLFAATPYLTQTVYKLNEIEFPLRIYTFVLLIQGAQGILNSVIAGLQRFKRLFIYQVAIAGVSLVLYIPLVYQYRVNGYYIALLLFNLVSTITLLILALWPLRRYLKMPTKKDLAYSVKNILLLSLGIYTAKVLYTFWAKFGQFTLGYFEALEVVGVFSFALLFSSKLQTISDALTDVNLPVFSKGFAEDLENFKNSFIQNFKRIFVFILFAALSASFFARDAIIFAVGHKYDASIRLIFPLVLSFSFYSYINLLKSSVLIPAKMIWEMIVGYLLLVIGTVAAYFLLITRFESLSSMAYAMLFGSAVSFVLTYMQIHRKLKFDVLNSRAVFLAVLLFTIAPFNFFPLSFLLKLSIYSGYVLLLFLTFKKEGLFASV